MDAPQSGNRVEFKCPECNTTVVYERKTVLGAFRKRKAEPAAAPGISVFLWCENGHVHRYEIPSPGAKGQATHAG